FALVALALIVALPGAASKRASAAPQVVPRFPRVLDVVSDGVTDQNGIPLNPRWGYQHSAECPPQSVCSPSLPLPRADARDLCPLLLVSDPAAVGGQSVNPDCTSQHPANDLPGMGIFNWSRLFCSIWAGGWNGHSNWGLATYTGNVYWEDHSSAGGGDDEWT